MIVFDHSHVSPLLLVFSFVGLGFGFLLPAIMGAASLVGKVIGNKKKQKQQQQQYDAERQQWEMYEKPKLEQASRRNLMKSNLAASIARSYGLDKVLPNFFNFRDRADDVANPYERMRRPGGFSWGSFLGDALGTGAQAYGAYSKNKELEKAFPDRGEYTRAKYGIPLGGESRRRTVSLGTDPRSDWTGGYDYDE